MDTKFDGFEYDGPAVEVDNVLRNRDILCMYGIGVWYSDRLIDDSEISNGDIRDYIYSIYGI